MIMQGVKWLKDSTLRAISDPGSTVGHVVGLCMAYLYSQHGWQWAQGLCTLINS